MNNIEHVISPDRLLLVWRSSQAGASRTRRVVAEVVADAEASNATLRYLHDTPDFLRAQEEGFGGYPAFNVKQVEHSKNVLDSFLRRLPPRKRGDFQRYLDGYGIPPGLRLTDMALLAYTNAKLPSDGFELYADLRQARPPFELVIEIAGFRHQDAVTIDDIYVGDPVKFKLEPDNAHDCNAVAVFHSGLRIGYIDKAQAPSFQTWLRKGYHLSAVVERVNGTADRPVIYVYVAVR
ncbi:HIRAN domain-containing protein [Agrobacterium pusense]|uniref:HIRAN domain-containing protein n=1 Tax=Agrobacterium pusense TaxID=648995 RepID=UPI0032D9D29B